MCFAFRVWRGVAACWDGWSEPRLHVLVCVCVVGEGGLLRPLLRAPLAGFLSVGSESSELPCSFLITALSPRGWVSLIVFILNFYSLLCVSKILFLFFFFFSPHQVLWSAGLISGILLVLVMVLVISFFLGFFTDHALHANIFVL